MPDLEPDFTQYSLPDLHDAARHIDRHKYPELAARLDAELKRRALVSNPIGSGASSSRSSSSAQSGSSHRSLLRDTTFPIWLVIGLVFFVVVVLFPLSICFGLPR